MTDWSHFGAKVIPDFALGDLLLAHHQAGGVQGEATRGLINLLYF